MAKKLTKTKARQILHDKEVHGQPLTDKQRRFFGAIAGGAKPYKAENGIEGTMGGLTDKGFNFNPAWGGAWREGGDLPKSQKGKNVCPPGFVNIEGRCYDRSSDEYKNLYREGIGYLDKTGTFVSSRMELPEVVVKPKSVLDFLDKSAPELSNKWYDGNEEAVRYGFDQVLKKYGIPNLKSQEEYAEKYPLNPFSWGLGHYWDNTIYADNIPRYFGELAHHVDRQGLEKRFMMRDVPNYIMGNDPYEVEGTAEHTAHKIIEPQINSDFEKSIAKWFMDYYRPSVDKKENGGWLEKYTDSVPMAQFGLTYSEPNSPKLPRVGPSSELAMSVGGENGELAYLIPTMKYGRMQVDPLFEFKRTGEHLGGPFKTWQEAEAWERDVRHPYVEKGQSIPTPYRRWGQFAMGGGLPGSVGFTYARVAGAAPSEGPYAKKTLPSAQNGQEMKYYQEGLDWKPKTISKNGGWLDKYNEDVPQAQPGILQQRYSVGPMMGDIAQQSGVPSQAEIARQAEIRKQVEVRNQQIAARARYEAMPKIGPARERSYSEQVQANEQRRRLNQAYAAQNPEVTTDESGNIIPSGYGRFMQTYGKNVDRFASGLASTANYVWSTPGKVVQSAYKPGYSLKDALLGKPSNSSVLEDIFTDPGTLATFGGKGVLKLAPKMLAPMFAVTRLASPMAEARFTEQLDRVKNMVSSPEAKRAFNQVRDAVSRNQQLASVDPAYQRAMMDESLPEKAIDEIAKSYTTADPAQSRLTKEQADYVRNLSSLSVDMRNIMHFPIEDQVNFLLENSKNIAPRDIFPFLYQTQRSTGRPSLNENQLRKTFSDIIKSYGETSVENPLAEYSAATDLFSLADTFGNTNTSLKSDFARALDALNSRGEMVRPNVSIRPEYYDPALEKYNVREAIHVLVRDPYRSIPTPQDRLRSMRESGKQILSSMNRIIQDPSNKGVPFVGARSLSTDSYPITLSLMARNKDAVDFVPIHLGSHNDVLAFNNSMSGLSGFGRMKRDYLGERSKDLMNRLGQTPGTQLPYQELQRSLIDTRYLNTSIDELNKAAQSNFPAAISEIGEIKSPLVGIIPKQQDGGETIKDDEGYWNPQNWGKPVEINSNQITMEGVLEPLLGVSDTGDTQMMYPGKNYTFEGTKVVEYPREYFRAEYGKSVNRADEYPLEKLDNLLNFTNYNKPKAKNGGWLDKYK